MAYPSNVIVTEVGMREGFQMESRIRPTDTKAEVGLALIGAGIKRLEATSFVSPRAVPQVADAAQLNARVPNVNGAWRAVSAGIATGQNLARLVEVAQTVQTLFGREIPGQVMKAGPR